MEAWTEFVLARYNYWIVIVLMMLGLYIVFARGNLVKKIVGLNIFQTSVFIFYITMGKIAGGTAPIYVKEDLEQWGHGGGHEGAEEAGHGVEAAAHGVEDAVAAHAKIANELPANDLKAALNSAPAQDAGAASGSAEISLHAQPEMADKIANAQLIDPAKDAATQGFDIAGAGDHGAAAHQTAGAIHDAAATIYTNPLPSVLILTAIVVGVAGTAVGLALAVRIREAYGTIEEDELEAIDNVAEFGDGAEGRAA